MRDRPHEASQPGPPSRGRSDLAERFAAGDAEAFAVVQPIVEKIVFYRRWRFRDPESVVQDVLWRLVEFVRAGRFRGESSFETFVHTVTQHLCIDTYRRDRRLDQREEPEKPDGPDPASPRRTQQEILESRERLRALEYVYQRLSEPCRQLWRWVYFEKKRAAEVAEALGTSEGNVRVRVHRCLKRAQEIGRELIVERPSGGDA